MLVKHLDLILAAGLFAASLSPAAFAQAAPPPAILTVDIANAVEYVDDVTDFTKLATVQTATVGGAALNFRKFTIIGDIVAVNGTPVTGTLVEDARAISMSPNPTPGQAISATTRSNMNYFGFEILSANGVQIGTIAGIGIGAGSPPPGAPLVITQGNNPLTGGNGAFLGVRGVMGQAVTAQTVSQRVASVTEDPAQRRNLGGGTLRFVLYLIPMTRPEVATSASGPAVFHADFSAVTAAKPAKAGEVLIVRATGLGPTVPGVNPGDPFPSDAPPAVNSPVQASLGGQPAQVVNAIGWPGLVDTYRVDVVVPDGTPSGAAALQLTAAWISGSPVNISIQ